MRRYGHFDDEHREYVITDPRTPVKWINYVGSLAFGGFVDHTGGSLICKGDPALNRITRYNTQLPSSDFRGETLYLRIRREAGYRVFSPYYVPTLDPLDLYECHVGLGYVRIVSVCHGLRTDVTIFVPLGENRLLRDYRITNVTDRAMEVDAIPVVEYTHFDALKQLTNADWVPQTMQSRAFREDGGLLVLAQYAFMRRDTAINYLTSNHPVSSWESERPRFLGDNEYGTWAHPLALQQEELANGEANRGDNIGALLHALGRLEPGETRRLVTQLGQEESIEKAMPGIRRYRDGGEVDRALAELAEFWDRSLSAMQVETPDADMNRMLNVHNPRQCRVTLQWSRYLSLYQLGFGSRGIGFRDSAQDVLGVLPQAPDEGRARIEQLLATQRRDGAAMHQFNPLTMVATMGDSEEMPDRPQYYSDDAMWIVLAVAAYLKETGDLAFLDRVIPFYEKDRRGAAVEEAPVADHLRRAIEFTRSNVGAHGLPLLGYADWNDTINLRSGAESVFVAQLYGKALAEAIELARFLGDAAPERLYLGYADEMRSRVNQHAWDGQWYVRYFDADGTPLGSHRNTEGQIYINSQSWAVISGQATPERAADALESVYRRLHTPYGLMLSAPGFNGYDPDKGGITTYPPGAKENGGIFLHTNPWAMIAETRMGNGDRAFEYYCAINPVTKNDRIDEFQCEPYVYPQNVLGREHSQAGLARNSWLTGTASWCTVAATQHILGITPTYQGLLIRPCIPHRWDGFSVTRRFRGATYRITVHNPHHVCGGVESVRVDGREIEGDEIPAAEPGRDCAVDVRMGR